MRSDIRPIVRSADRCPAVPVPSACTRESRRPARSRTLSRRAAQTVGEMPFSPLGRPPPRPRPHRRSSQCRGRSGRPTVMSRRRSAGRFGRTARIRSHRPEAIRNRRTRSQVEGPIPFIPVVATLRTCGSAYQLRVARISAPILDRVDAAVADRALTGPPPSIAYVRHRDPRGCAHPFRSKIHSGPESRPGTPSSLLTRLSAGSTDTEHREFTALLTAMLTTGNSQTLHCPPIAAPRSGVGVRIGSNRS